MIFLFLLQKGLKESLKSKKNYATLRLHSPLVSHRYYLNSPKMTLIQIICSFSLYFSLVREKVEIKRARTITKNIQLPFVLGEVSIVSLFRW